jgi:hypothetical protein
MENISDAHFSISFADFLTPPRTHLFVWFEMAEKVHQFADGGFLLVAESPSTSSQGSSWQIVLLVAVDGLSSPERSNVSPGYFPSSSFCDDIAAKDFQCLSTLPFVDSAGRLTPLFTPFPQNRNQMSHVNTLAWTVTSQSAPSQGAMFRRTYLLYAAYIKIRASVLRLRRLGVSV